MTTSTSTSPLATPVPPRAAPRPQIDPRYIPPMLITLILLGSNFLTGNLESPWKTGLAIVTAIVLEAGLSRLMRGSWPHLASAYISGISVGILVRSPFFWPFALCAAISILSKYAIRLKGRHIWNPSNFGIVMMLFFAPKAVASLSVQWDNRLTMMIPIWCVGLLVLWRLRRVHIAITYALSFVAFAGIRTLISGDPFLANVAPITGPMYQLFTIFMVTDPATTVPGFRPQILVVFLVAAVEAVLRLNGDVHAPYHALFLVGPTALILHRLRTPHVVTPLRDGLPANPA
ncbi:MAG: hypothetical protein ACH37Z_02790 [Anaerolineae bacterium]|jgi:hypothetical protein